MSYDKCYNCGKWGRTSTHKCPPAWGVYPDNSDYEDDDATRVYADDANEAARILCEQWDSYSGESGSSEMDVVVFPLTDPSAKQRFTVRGELVPQYTVQEKK